MNQNRHISNNNMTHLHCHTYISNIRLIDCIIKPEELINKAVELGNKGVAITDHEALSAHVQALLYVKEGKEKGVIPKDFKLILGNEIYLVDEIKEYEENRWCDNYYHFILLAKDKKGHEQLRKLSSIAWSENYHRTNKIAERVPTLKQNLIDIIGEEKGHLVASTACLGGELGKILIAIKNLEEQEYDNFGILTKEESEELKQDSINKQKEKLNSFLDFCQDMFGEDFYLEMQPNEFEEQRYVNKKILEISKERNIKFITTCDCHYLNKEDRIIHEAFLKSKEEDRELDNFYDTTYMMNCEEIHSFLDNVIGYDNVNLALNNTLEITNKIEEYDLYHDQIVPKIPLGEFELHHYFKDKYDKYDYIKKFAYSDNNYDKYFLYLIENGWKKKEWNALLTEEKYDEMCERLNLEFEAIWESSIRINDHISSYYITALEIVNMMWDDDGGDSFVGCSRGSIACFYTAYLIGLQQINPMKFNIPYWRHLHASRPEMPDFIMVFYNFIFFVESLLLARYE